MKTTLTLLFWTSGMTHAHNCRKLLQTYFPKNNALSTDSNQGQFPCVSTPPKTHCNKALFAWTHIYTKIKPLRHFYAFGMLSHALP